MIFIGQTHIMNELRDLLRDLYVYKSMGENLLFVGPSGYGKTTIATSVCGFLAEKNFDVFQGETCPVPPVFGKRVVFVDEIHKYRSIELFYPLMDSKRHILVFATNENGDLPEPFLNRCSEYIFGDYTDEELLLICLQHAAFKTSHENIRKIIAAGNRNPRIIKRLLDKFERYLRYHTDVDPLTTDFNTILEEVFQIEDGLDVLCRRYLQVLNDIGGTGSLLTLKSLLHVSEQILKTQVEPVLMQKGLIKVTSKGRSIL